MADLDKERGFFYTTAGWMAIDLGLSGKELSIYSIIYGFSQDGNSEYSGSYKFISDVTGLSRQSIINAVNSLIEKGYIVKTTHGNGVNSYRALWGSQKSLLVKDFDQIVKSFDHQKPSLSPPTTPSITPSNILLNNNSLSSFSAEDFKTLWNSIVVNLSKVTILSEPRRKKIISRMKEMSELGDINSVLTCCLRKINESSFCCGDNDRGWKASFDWFIDSGNNWVKVYEGKYDNKGASAPSQKEYPDGTYWKKDFTDEEIKRLFGYDLPIRQQLLRGYCIQRKNGKWFI